MKQNEEIALVNEERLGLRNKGIPWYPKNDGF